MVWAAGAFSSLTIVSAVIMLPALRRAALTDSRLRSVRDRASVEIVSGDPIAAWLRPFGVVGRAVISTGILSQKTLEDLEQTVTAAGQRSGPALSLFVGAKIALMILLPLTTYAVATLLGVAFIRPIFLAMFAAIIGLVLPDFIVKKIRKNYLLRVEGGLPAALDMLIICAEAGLSLETGFERVALEFTEAIPSTANELKITANEMKILSDRRQALLNMGRRTSLESMMRLGSVLAQSQKYGTPLTQALRVLAAEMRALTLTRFEARAGRLPVLLTIPMILFILPCLFVVIIGPAAVQIMSGFRN